MSDAHTENTTVLVDKLVHGGDGLGRLASGEVVFIPYAAPQEQLEVAVTRVGTKIVRCGIDKVLKPSDVRIDARCSVFTKCGGCDWQHLTLDAQKQWKKEIIRESLERLGGLRDVEIKDVLEPDDPKDAWNYRNHVRWFVSYADGGVQLGYHAYKSHDVIPFDVCHIMPDGFNRLADWLAENLPRECAITSIQAKASVMGKWLITFYLAREREPITEEFIASLMTAFPEIAGLTRMLDNNETTLFGQPYLTEAVGSWQFRVSSGSFFQVNSWGLNQMMRVLKSWLPVNSDRLLDLYSGVGLFGICFAMRAKEVVMIESSKSAIEDAKANIETSQFSNVKLVEGEVRRLIRRFDEEFDVAIIDPPREGLERDIAEWLSAQIKSKLIYISCDPASLARDLSALTKAGWQIKEVQPIDMFPQTFHVETLVHLVKG